MGRHLFKAFNTFSEVGSKLGGNQAGATGKGRDEGRGQWIQKAISVQNPGQKRTNEEDNEEEPDSIGDAALLSKDPLSPSTHTSEPGEGDDLAEVSCNLWSKEPSSRLLFFPTDFYILMFVGRKASGG